MSEKPNYLESIGICPVCKNGNIIRTSIGYSCSNFKSIENQCKFLIYSMYFDKEITKEIATKLVEDGETDTFKDFHRKDGEVFWASLKVESGKVNVSFKNMVLDTPCPTCGDKIEKLINGYACKQYTNTNEQGERLCSVFIPSTICGQTILKDDIETLLKGEQTRLIGGFINKAGIPFASRLLLTKTMNVVFANALCKCPKCESGVIFVNKKAYNCSNYRNEDVKCNFTIWREMLSREITEEEAIILCTNKETETLSGFVLYGNAVEKKLIINEDFKVLLA